MRRVPAGRLQGGQFMANRLIRHAGKVITVAHATKCVAKKFKGCSKAETAAVLKVIERLARASMRRSK